MKAFLLAGLGLAVAQLGSLDAPSARPKQFVTYAAEQHVLTAGKRGVLELRFQVQPGFHVNSHTPKSDLQIPTNVSIAPEAGVKVDRFEYPPGKSYSVSFDPGEKLDVYSDQFVIRVSVTATPGAHELKGVLKYQACNTAACYPPKTLAVAVPFTAN